MKNIITLFFILSLLLIVNGNEADISENEINEEYDNYNNVEEEINNIKNDENKDNIDNTKTNNDKNEIIKKLLDNLIKTKNILVNLLKKGYKNSVEGGQKFLEYTNKNVKNIYYNKKISEQIDDDINTLINDACSIHKCDYIGLKKNYIFNAHNGNNGNTYFEDANYENGYTIPSYYINFNNNKCIYNELENYAYKILRAKLMYMQTRKNSHNDSARIKKAEKNYKIKVNEIYTDVAKLINSIPV